MCDNVTDSPVAMVYTEDTKKKAESNRNQKTIEYGVTAIGQQPIDYRT